MTIGERLSALRHKHSMTQPMLAEKLNVSQSTVTSWENDRRAVMIDDLKSLAKLFNVTTDYLLGINATPEWETYRDIIDLQDVLNGAWPSFSFGGYKLTVSQKERLKLALTLVFWDELQQQKKQSKRNK